MLVSFYVHAVTLSVELPVTREDGTDITLNEFRALNVYCGLKQGDYNDSYYFVELDFPTTSVIIPPYLGTHYFNEF